jgi:hypothetical protein
VTFNSLRYGTPEFGHPKDVASWLASNLAVHTCTLLSSTKLPVPYNFEVIYNPLFDSGRMVNDSDSVGCVDPDLTGTQKKRKKRKFHIFMCVMIFFRVLKPEGFFCSMEILHGGLRINSNSLVLFPAHLFNLFLIFPYGTYINTIGIHPRVELLLLGGIILSWA